MTFAATPDGHVRDGPLMESGFHGHLSTEIPPVFHVCSMATGLCLLEMP